MCECMYILSIELERKSFLSISIEIYAMIALPRTPPVYLYCIYVYTYTYTYTYTYIHRLCDYHTIARTYRRISSTSTSALYIELQRNT